ncbi:MAG: ribonuclease Z [Bacteroidales bacterium]|nr:ribonuclease Z [Bacteroidales bacterium]
MNFSLKILGTASAMPFSDRNPSAQALSVHGRLFLIDCGEGTQQQFRRMHLSFLKVEAIFLTHIHGDHVFGIFGLLSTMGMYGRTQELHIYAPQSFAGILKFFLAYFGDGINFGIVHHTLNMKEPEVVHVSRCVQVSAFPLRHKIDCYGFRFDEIRTARQLEKAPAVSYAYCSDTMPFPELSSWVRGVDILYHEATYVKSMSDKAVSRFHSTTTDAAACALAAGAGKLLVGHYSSRISDFEGYLAECREVFPETFALSDGDVFDF